MVVFLVRSAGDKTRGAGRLVTKRQSSIPAVFKDAAPLHGLGPGEAIPGDRGAPGPPTSALHVGRPAVGSAPDAVETRSARQPNRRLSGIEACFAAASGDAKNWLFDASAVFALDGGSRAPFDGASQR